MRRLDLRPYLSLVNLISEAGSLLGGAAGGHHNVLPDSGPYLGR